jgi:hypothetical protein
MTDKPKWTDLFGIDPDYTADAVEEPKYTESDMQVLTEAALRLGRKEAGEEIAAAINVARIQRRWKAVAMAAAGECAQIARVIGSQPSPDTTSGRTDPGMDSDLPQDSHAGRAGAGG